MGNIWSTNESVFFVGGRGTKAGDANAGGGCTKDVWGDLKSPNLSLSDVMGTNGEPVSDPSAWNGSATACTVTQSSAGKLLITKTGAFTNVIAGLIANVNFSSVYGDGRYRVNAAQLTADTIEIEYPYSIDITCDVKVGGAFDTLQNALDSTTADQSTYHDVNILTNKPKTFSGEGDRIDIDVGGGNGNAGSWKRIIGIDDDGVELAAGSYVTFDGNSQACHVFYINNINNIEFRHIYPKDAGTNCNGFSVEASVVSMGYSFIHCKSTGCKHGIYAATWYAYMIYIEGGHYISTESWAIYIYQARYVTAKKVEFVGTTTYPLVHAYNSGHFELDGCMLRKTAGFTNGILGDLITTWLSIKNCVFYNIDDCIELNDDGTKLTQYNNIFVLHTAATGKIIKRTKGSITYSDYSCAWAIDGAPSASGRWGGTGLPEHAIEQNPQFVDADNGDFRPRNPSVLRGGKPDMADNAAQMGAILQEYQFVRRAKVANLSRLQIIR
jgi:hypothetical protein